MNFIKILSFAYKIIRELDKLIDGDSIQYSFTWKGHVFTVRMDRPE